MIYDIEVQIAFQRIGHWKKYFEESERRNQSQDIDHSGSDSDDFDSDSDQGWQKVKKARRKGKTIEDASFFISCTPTVGKGLANQPNIGDASGTIGSNILTGYNLPPEAGGASGTPSSSIPDSDSGDRAIRLDPLNPSSLISFLINQWLDLPWARPVTCLNPEPCCGKLVDPHRVPLYERQSTLLNPRQEEPSHQEPLVIII